VNVHAEIIKQRSNELKVAVAVGEIQIQVPALVFASFFSLLTEYNSGVRLPLPT
jgi:hypothetical protein